MSGGRSLWPLSAALSCLALLAIASTADAQQARCDFPNTPQTRTYLEKLPSGEYNYFQGGGVVVRCPSKDVTITADSLEYYGDERRVYLVRNVHYSEPRFTLNSQFLTYYMPVERIVATQNVHAVLPSGSTLDGPQVEYLRAVPRIRTRAQVTAIFRPTAHVVQKDSAGQPQPPITVVANTLFMDGDSLLYGSGRVDLTREELAAHGDSIFLDSGAETMRLMRGPVLEGKRDRPFRLTGTLIDVFASERHVRRVISRGNAVATSEDMTLRADTIDLRVDADALQRAMAWGGSRARATSSSQTIVADSIDAIMPDQRVREVHAIANAVAEGKADTTHFHPDTTDWLRGDTIIARFDTVAKGDTTPTRMRELVAIGTARSYYQVPPSDTTQRRPAVSYVRGLRITVAFADGQVSNVVVTGQAVGVYAEPSAEAAARETPANARPGARPPTRQPGARPPTARPQTPPIRRPTARPPASRP